MVRWTLFSTNTRIPMLPRLVSSSLWLKGQLLTGQIKNQSEYTILVTHDANIVVFHVCNWKSEVQRSFLSVFSNWWNQITGTDLWLTIKNYWIESHRNHFPLSRWKPNCAYWISKKVDHGVWYSLTFNYFSSTLKSQSLPLPKSFWINIPDRNWIRHSFDVMYCTF